MAVICLIDLAQKKKLEFFVKVMEENFWKTTWKSFEKLLVTAIILLKLAERAALAKLAKRAALAKLKDNQLVLKTNSSFLAIAVQIKKNFVKSMEVTKIRVLL